jgi:hypothetical protein
VPRVCTSFLIIQTQKANGVKCLEHFDSALVDPKEAGEEEQRQKEREALLFGVSFC